MIESQETLPTKPEPIVRTIRRGVVCEAKQGVRCSIGVSEQTCGANSLSMQVIRIPPGGGSLPHLHRRAETALYLLHGQGMIFYGPDLALKTVVGPGEFLFIPPNTPYQARNLSDCEPVIAVAAYTDAHAQENVELYDLGGSE